MKVEYNEGIYLPEIDLWLDSSEGKGRCVVTHAHADHIAHHRQIIATRETARLFIHRRGAAHIITQSWGEKVDYGKYSLTLFPAGHCLGAAQVLVEYLGERLIYTGDIKLKPNLTVPEAQIVECDTLITESTFGDPKFVFPPQEQIYSQAVSLVRSALNEGAVPVVYSYALGKSQEALELFLRNGFKVTLHGAVWNVSEIYRELGVNFSAPYEKYNRYELEGRVLITPPSTRFSKMISNIAKKRTIMLTGWALTRGVEYMYRGVDRFVPMSDHADYNELLELIQKSKAKKVYTLYGKRKFATRLKSLGIDATFLG